MTMRPTRIEVYLEAYRHNYRAIKNILGKSKIMPIVKADGYGLGVIPVSWLFKSEGADFFGVSSPDEAQTLRKGGILDRILIVGAPPCTRDVAEFCVREDVRPAVSNMDLAQFLSDAAVRMNRTAAVHIAVDSGMGRIGVMAENAADFALKVAALPGIVVEGMFTHFSVADEADLSWTYEQAGRFQAAVAEVRGRGIPVIAHCCNSAGVLIGDEKLYMDYVRPGTLIHGMIPSPECGKAVGVELPFALKTAIAMIRDDIPEGWPISYGRTYRAQKGDRTAVLPIGYADGLPRVLSNRGTVLIRGTRCPIVGRVCMDQCMVNVAHVPDVQVGDEAVLIGTQGNETIGAQEFAEAAGTVTTAVPCMFTARVPRVYKKDYQEC
ncbi:MAG: alanine racemase [Pyramidobacter sp.]|nr:alanine racemase [Pyramidobacter sp.]